MQTLRPLSSSRFPSITMSSLTNGMISNTKTIPSTDVIAKLIRSVFAIYDFGLTMTLRSLSIAGFICKCYWNIFVSIIILSFLFIVSVYRILFIATMRTKSVMRSRSNSFRTTRNRTLSRYWIQRTVSIEINFDPHLDRQKRSFGRL